ncbi:MAG: cupin domain-containing protein [Candidatus Marinimicrobia bacterium]|jgi:quercetin dioxygenase-like cupin family protein|nr:cupin domain-containing protein [Candidatus Neomarinimicrobiota bacterium]
MKQELLDNGGPFFYIDDKGLDYPLTKEGAAYKIAENKYTVKIEGLEYLVPESASVHGFIAPAGAKSFPTHTDLVDLKIRCIEGTKGFEVEGVKYTLEAGNYVLVPKGVEHRALNVKASIMLSIEV